MKFSLKTLLWGIMIVAAIMAGLALWGSIEVFAQARGELRST